MRFVTLTCTLQWIAWEDGVRGDVRSGWDGQCRMLVAERLAQVRIQRKHELRFERSRSPGGGGIINLNVKPTVGK